MRKEGEPKRLGRRFRLPTLLAMLLVLGLGSITDAVAQTGDVFWFDVPEHVRYRHDDYSVYLHVTSLGRPVEVEIDLPAEGHIGFKPITFSLKAGEEKKIQLGAKGPGRTNRNLGAILGDQGYNSNEALALHYGNTRNFNQLIDCPAKDRPKYIENLLAWAESDAADYSGAINKAHPVVNRTNKGVRMRAFELDASGNRLPQNTTNRLISSYLEMGMENSYEILVLKGANALGSSFVVPMQDMVSIGWKNRYHTLNPAPAYSSMNIVATEDETLVRVVTPYPIFLKETGRYGGVKLTRAGTGSTGGTTGYAYDLWFEKAGQSSILAPYAKRERYYYYGKDKWGLWEWKQGYLSDQYQVMADAETYPAEEKAYVGLGGTTIDVVGGKKKVAVTVRTDDASGKDEHDRKLVYGSSVSSNGPDYIADQLVPVDFFGSTYVAIPGKRGSHKAHEWLFITAVEDGTEVRAWYNKNSVAKLPKPNDKLPVNKKVSLQRGEQISLLISGYGTVSVVASKAVGVFQVTGMQETANAGQRAGGLLPPLPVGPKACRGTRSVVLSRPQDMDFYLNLVAFWDSDPEISAIGNFKLEKFNGTEFVPDNSTGAKRFLAVLNDEARLSDGLSIPSWSPETNWTKLPNPGTGTNKDLKRWRYLQIQMNKSRFMVGDFLKIGVPYRLTNGKNVFQLGVLHGNAKYDPSNPKPQNMEYGTFSDFVDMGKEAPVMNITTNMDVSQLSSCNTGKLELKTTLTEGLKYKWFMCDDEGNENGGQTAIYMLGDKEKEEVEVTVPSAPGKYYVGLNVRGYCTSGASAILPLKVGANIKLNLEGLPSGDVCVPLGEEHTYGFKAMGLQHADEIEWSYQLPHKRGLKAGTTSYEFLEPEFAGEQLIARKSIATPGTSANVEFTSTGDVLEQGFMTSVFNDWDALKAETGGTPWYPMKLKVTARNKGGCVVTKEEEVNVYQGVSKPIIGVFKTSDNTLLNPSTMVCPPREAYAQPDFGTGEPPSNLTYAWTSDVPGVGATDKEKLGDFELKNTGSTAKTFNFGLTVTPKGVAGCQVTADPLALKVDAVFKFNGLVTGGPTSNPVLNGIAPGEETVSAVVQGEASYAWQLLRGSTVVKTGNKKDFKLPTGPALAPGSYTIKLTVRSECGGSKEASRTFKIVKAYTVSFRDPDAPSYKQERTIEDGGTLIAPETAPTPPKDASLKEWKNQADATDRYKVGDTQIKKDVTLIPVWEYKVTFDGNGAPSGAILPSNRVQMVEKGEQAIEPALPTWLGHKFEGWYTTSTCKDADKYAFSTAINAPRTLYAKWAVVHSVTIDPKNDTGQKRIYAYDGKKLRVGTDIEEDPSAPTALRKPKHWMGWEREQAGTSTPFDPRVDAITGPATIAGVWGFQATFDASSAEGSPAIAPQVKRSDRPYDEPTIRLERKGYTHAGWEYEKGSSWPRWRFTTSAGFMQRDITLRPMWSAKDVKVRFMLNGEEYVREQAVKYGTPVARPTDDPSATTSPGLKVGETFEGWQPAGASNTWSFADGVEGDAVFEDSKGELVLVLVAKITTVEPRLTFTVANEKKVYAWVKGGYDATKVYKADDIIELGIDEKKGYDADVKYDGARDEGKGKYKVVGDQSVSIFVGYLPKDVEVSFHNSDGAILYTKSGKYGEVLANRPTSAPVDPTGENRSFAGWSLDGTASMIVDLNSFRLERGVTDDMKLKLTAVYLRMVDLELVRQPEKLDGKVTMSSVHAADGSYIRPGEKVMRENERFTLTPKDVAGYFWATKVEMVGQPSPVMPIGGHYIAKSNVTATVKWQGEKQWTLTINSNYTADPKLVPPTVLALDKDGFTLQGDGTKKVLATNEHFTVETHSGDYVMDGSIVATNTVFSYDANGGGNVAITVNWIPAERADLEADDLLVSVKHNNPRDPSTMVAVSPGEDVLKVGEMIDVQPLSPLPSGKKIKVTGVENGPAIGTGGSYKVTGDVKVVIGRPIDTDGHTVTYEDNSVVANGEILPDGTIIKVDAKDGNDNPIAVIGAIPVGSVDSDGKQQWKVTGEKDVKVVAQDGIPVNFPEDKLDAIDDKTTIALKSGDKKAKDDIIRVGFDGGYDPKGRIIGVKGATAESVDAKKAGTYKVQENVSEVLFFLGQPLKVGATLKPGDAITDNGSPKKEYQVGDPVPDGTALIIPEKDASDTPLMVKGATPTKPANPGDQIVWVVDGDTPVEVCPADDVIVNFFKEDGITADGTETYKFGQTVSYVPTKEGHTLTSWKKQGATTPNWALDKLIDEQGPIALVPVWEANDVVVNFYAEKDDLSPMHTQTFKYGELVSYNKGGVTTPTKTGYTFKGWKKKGTGEKWDGKAIQELGPIDLYCDWEKKVYTVSFDLQNPSGGAITNEPSKQTVKYQEQASEPSPAPSLEGYEFAGWFKEATCQTEFVFTTPIEEATTLYAKWLKVHTVTLHIGTDATYKGKTPGTDGNVVIKVTDGNPLPSNEPKRTGYTFKWWRGGTGTYAPGTYEVKADATLEAEWVPMDVTIVYNLDGGTANPPLPTGTTVKYGTAVAEPTGVFEKTGDRFNHWQVEKTGEKWDFGKNVEGDAVTEKGGELFFKLKAIYDATYTLTVIDKDGVPADGAVAPTVAGDKVTIKGSKTTAITGEEVELVVPNPVKGYEAVVYPRYANETGATDEYKYTVAGGDEVEFEVEWQAKTVDITFEDADGNTHATRRAKYGLTIDDVPGAPNAPQGMKFLGWSTDGSKPAIDDFTKYKLGKDVSDNMKLTLMPVFQARNVTVSYMHRGEAYGTAEPVEYGALITNKPDPVEPTDLKAGKETFEGWFYAGATDAWDFDADKVEGSLVVENAKGELELVLVSKIKTEECRLTFTVADAAKVDAAVKGGYDPKRIYEKDELIKLAIDEKKGYTAEVRFNGVTDEGGNTYKVKGDESILIEVGYSAKDVKVIFDPNNGEAEMEKMGKYGELLSDRPTTPTTIPSGKKFAGWSLDGTSSMIVDLSSHRLVQGVTDGMELKLTAVYLKALNLEIRRDPLIIKGMQTVVRINDADGIGIAYDDKFTTKELLEDDRFTVSPRAVKNHSWGVKVEMDGQEVKATSEGYIATNDVTVSVKWVENKKWTVTLAPEGLVDGLQKPTVGVVDKEGYTLRADGTTKVLTDGDMFKIVYTSSDYDLKKVVVKGKGGNKLTPDPVTGYYTADGDITVELTWKPADLVDLKADEALVAVKHADPENPSSEVVVKPGKKVLSKGETITVLPIAGSTKNGKKVKVIGAEAADPTSLNPDKSGEYIVNTDGDPVEVIVGREITIKDGIEVTQDDPKSTTTPAGQIAVPDKDILPDGKIITVPTADADGKPIRVDGAEPVGPVDKDGKQQWKITGDEDIVVEVKNAIKVHFDDGKLTVADEPGKTELKPEDKRAEGDILDVQPEAGKDLKGRIVKVTGAKQVEYKVDAKNGMGQYEVAGPDDVKITVGQPLQVSATLKPGEKITDKTTGEEYVDGAPVPDGTTIQVPAKDKDDNYIVVDGATGPIDNGDGTYSWTIKGDEPVKVRIAELFPFTFAEDKLNVTDINKQPNLELKNQDKRAERDIIDVQADSDLNGRIIRVTGAKLVEGKSDAETGVGQYEVTGPNEVKITIGYAISIPDGVTVEYPNGDEIKDGDLVPGGTQIVIKDGGNIIDVEGATDADGDGIWEVSEDSPVVIAVRSTGRFHATILGGTDVEDAAGEPLQALPNPTSGPVQLKGMNGEEHVRVFNLVGKLVLEVETTGALDLSQLRNGAYIVRVGDQTVMVVKK